jgi:transglutaminase-like putative cysteine protease
MKITEARLSARARILAYLAVSCSIAAVAWTIRDPWLAAIGISGLALGHYYSWRRREFSIRRSLILLLFMVLTAFLGGDILRSGLSDRLLLSRYLIYGLVIGSFDLMRMRNVIASVVLGGLLLVMVSELALNLWFLVFPAAFIILAIAAVASRNIETETEQAATVGNLGWQTTARFWASFALGTVVLSTTLFLFMPRLASHQVTQANWLPSRLDLGLDRLAGLPSKPSTSVTPGILPSTLGGEFPGEGSYTELGYAGPGADVPVMRVRSRISSYWRGLTLDRYDGRGWLTTSPQAQLLQRSSEEFVFPDSRIRNAEQSEYWQAYYLLSDQPNAVFTGYWPGRIYLPGETGGFLESGTLYRVLSVVPRARPASLRNDRIARYDTANLVLPPISQRTAELAGSIVDGAVTDYDKATRLERFLLASYAYSLDVEATPEDRDAVDYFLFEQQAGYCSHFATAMAVMARHVGLPARVAGGYLPGFIDPLTGAHVVRAGDAHAWVEIHFQRHGWVAFDPTPRPDAAMGFIGSRNWVYLGLEDITGSSLGKMVSPLFNSLSLGRVSIPGWAWLTLLAIAGIIASAIIIFKHPRKTARQEVAGYSPLDGKARNDMLTLYQRMLKMLARKGFPSRQGHQPPYEYATLIAADLTEGQEIVDWFTGKTCAAAYNPDPFDSSALSEARHKLSALKRALTKRR